MSQSHERITTEQVNFWIGLETYNHILASEPILVQVTQEHLNESQRLKKLPGILPGDEVQIMCIESEEDIYEPIEGDL